MPGYVGADVARSAALGRPGWKALR